MDKSKQEKIDQLVEWIVDSMDVNALESYVRTDLREYYESREDDEFNELYSDMVEMFVG